MTRSSCFQLSAAAVLAAGLGFAQGAEDLRLTVGKSVVIDYPSDVRQISTSNPEVVDASPVTTREILLHGKGLGSATMVVWSKSGQRTFYNVNVELNLDPLRRLLKDSFPGEDIQPHSSRDSVSLNGRVSSKDVQDHALALAASFSKTVVNNMQLNGGLAEKQILLRVKFAELDRSREADFGVNLLGLPGQTQIATSTGQFSGPSLAAISGASSTGGAGGSGTTTAGSTALSITQALSIFAFNPKLNLGAFVKALENEQILEILTEPNIVTTNGKEANFLVGGEFPIPVLQGGSNSGAVTIQFREFGIRLKFLPLITDHSTIKMHLNQEVSTLDTADGVNLNGFLIPALSTRRAETDVELSEGQSFVIAGLVDNREQEIFNKTPILGSLPIFGALFKSKTEKKQRTDLLVIVTPEITNPLGKTDATPNLYMPRDFLVRMDSKDLPQPTNAKGSKK
ncbi:MAG TPA: pilus assembly protein N-terminal domain-containing protein [Bryobacteraceae bacterium]|nr:pilus assembly protein N-terminal domain-containing protein [Bryobacteraceae bacterium]